MSNTHYVLKTKPAFLRLYWFECRECRYCFLAYEDDDGNPILSTKEVINWGDTAVPHDFFQANDAQGKGAIQLEEATSEAPDDMVAA